MQGSTRKQVCKLYVVRRRSKLLLEKLVIKKGSVLDEGEKKKDGGAASGLTADQLISLLRTPVDAKSDIAQSGVVDDKVRVRLQL